MSVNDDSSRSDRDLVIVGGGIAGLYAALCVAREARVTLLAKGPLRSSASYLAQGGVAAAIGEDDDPALHAEDTIEAGRGLSRPSAVSVLTAEAPARVADLADLGVEFDAGPRPRRRPFARSRRPRRRRRDRAADRATFSRSAS